MVEREAESSDARSGFRDCLAVTDMMPNNGDCA